MTDLSEPTESRKWLAVAITAIAILAVCLSSYLTWVTWQQSAVAGCTGSSAAGCDEVLSSAGSKWLGIPVSLLGGLTYAAILAVVWPAVLWGGWTMTALLSLAMLAAGAGVWFIGSQAFIVQHFCLYCMTIHICGLLICTASFFVWRRAASEPNYDHLRAFFNGEEVVAQPPSLPDAFQPLLAASIASLGLLALVVGQVFFSASGMEIVESVPLEAVDTLAEDSNQDSTGQTAVDDSPAESNEPVEPQVEPMVVTDTEEVAEPLEMIDDLEEPATGDQPELSSGDAPLGEPNDGTENDVAFDLVNEPTDAPIDSPQNESVDSLFAEHPLPQEQETAKPVLGDAAPQADRYFRFKYLRRQIDAEGNPVIGNPYAGRRLVEMMDYTCPHCRRLHPFIQKAVERYGDQIGFVVYHVPLSRKCNPLVKADQTSHRNACDYARLAFGVWKLSPDKFEEYHNWLLTGDKPPSVYQAKTRAMELVGEAVLIDKTIEADLRKRVADSAAELELFKVGLPVLIFNEGIVKGIPESEGEWFKLFETRLGLSPLVTASK